MKAKKYTKETILDGKFLGIKDNNYYKFSIGDTIKIAQKIKEGDKERLQIFEGDVIAKHENGISSTFTLRKIASHSVAVERIFPLYSPIIKSIEFVRKGKVRRAKLYYIRERIGKNARVQEKVLTKEEKNQIKK